MQSLRRFLRHLALGCASVAFAQNAAGAQVDDRVHVDIPAQTLSSALAEFGRQTNSEIAFTPETVRSLRTAKVEGVLTPSDALALLVAGSGLTYRRNSDGVFVVAQAGGGHDSTTQLGDTGRVATTQSGTQIETVVVTARRRNESIQNVPGAITALSGDDLSKVHAQGFEDFIRSAPGLNMGSTGYGGLNNFSIRGIQTSPGVIPVQSPVSLYVNDTPTADPYFSYGSVNLYLVDIDRIEVLRGPQGTLFGSGSLSGAVRVLTREPELGAFSGFVQGSGTMIDGGGAGGGVEGMVNVPIGDNFAARGVLFFRDVPGYVDNIARHQNNVNSGSQFGGRFALRGEVTSDLTITATVIYQRDHFDDGAKSFADGEGNSRQWDSLSADTQTDTTAMGSLVAEYNLGWAGLTSSTSFLRKHNNVSTDADAASTALGFPGMPAYVAAVSESDAWVQEVRLASQLDGPVSFVLGFYYSDWHHSLMTVGRAPAVEAAFSIPNLISENLTAPIQEEAVFGELAWHVTDAIELAAGVRVSQDDFKSHQHLEGLLNGFAITDFSTHTTDRPVTPRFTATWRPSDELTLYAQAAEGYRIGQTNAAAPGVPLAFGPDSLWNYEVGVKSTFWDDRARVNAAAYYIDWKNLQVGLPGPFGGVYTANAGTARSIGLEVESSLMLTENLEFSTSFALGRAELTEDVPTLVQPSGIIGVHSGDRLPGSTDLTMSNELQYTRQVGDNMSLFLRVDHQYVGPSLNSFTALNANRIGGYHIFNADASIDLSDGLHLGAFVKNIANDDGTVNVVFGLFGSPLQDSTRVPPRTFGVSIRQDF